MAAHFEFVLAYLRPTGKWHEATANSQTSVVDEEEVEEEMNKAAQTSGSSGGIHTR